MVSKNCQPCSQNDTSNGQKIRPTYQVPALQIDCFTDQSLAPNPSELVSSNPGNRLLQGDVGSGKTIIALLACYFAHLNGTKSLLRLLPRF
jgi:hypothetical protein